MSYAWIRLLRNVQRKELEHKKTVDLSKVNEATPILDILYKPWDAISDPCFIEITGQEANSLEELTVHQNSLRKECLLIVDAGSTVAQKTKKEWAQFLDILNDLQMQEHSVAAQICAAGSPKETITSIVEYNCKISQIIEGTYFFAKRSHQHRVANRCCKETI